MTKSIHIECEEYVPIDVFKGLCTLKKSTVMADEPGCGDFAQAKKCRLCKNYATKEEHLGTCKGKHVAYPDMLAKTCEDFASKQ